MEADKLVKIIKSIEKSISSVFLFGVSIINVGITILLIFGAASSIILLRKLFPYMYLLLSVPMVAVYSIIFTIIKVTGVVIIILLSLYLIFNIKALFERQEKRFKKKRELDRKKFMDQVLKRLKMENKK